MASLVRVVLAGRALHALHQHVQRLLAIRGAGEHVRLVDEEDLACGGIERVVDGALQANMPISAEGLDLGELVKGPLKDVLPRRISLTPTIGGIDKEGLFALLRQAVDGKLADPAAWQAAAEQLLINNPVTLGIDDLSADFGVAKLEGAGEIEVASMTEVTGRAELRATGLDALIRRANATPELKMVAPMLIFLKGIGEPDGKEMVWRVAFSDGKLTVNDTQLSDMMPGK